MAIPHWVQKLQTRWGVTSGRQLVVILVVFACTGTSVMFLKTPLLPLLGVTPASPWWVRLLASLFVILPLYQVVLLFFGFLFGQFKFFWEFEKRFFGRMLGRKPAPKLATDPKPGLNSK
jgi:hypothetical protein